MLKGQSPLGIYLCPLMALEVAIHSKRHKILLSRDLVFPALGV